MSCPKCGKAEPHFVGPSLGESGFYICDQVEKPPMTSLRREAEVFLDAKPMSIPITEEPECVDALVAFIKAQRREEVEAIQAFRSKWGEAASIDHWLSQRKKELE